MSMVGYGFISLKKINSVVSTTYDYALSTDKINKPTGDVWKVTSPPWEPGKYRWTRTTIVYTNAPTYTTYSCDSSWEAVNGIEIGGRNLWIENKLVAGYMAGSPGTITPSPTMPQHQTMAELTAVKGGSNIVWQRWNPNKTVNGSNFNRVAFFDSSKTYLSLVVLPSMINSEYQSGVLTVPSNAAFARLAIICGSTTGGKDPDIKVKFEIGNKPTDWTPAPEDVQSSIDNIQVGGRNLLRQSGQWTKLPDSKYWKSNGGGIFLDSITLYHEVPTLKTTLPNGLGGHNTDWIELEVGETYTYSALIRSNATFEGIINMPMHYHCSPDRTGANSTVETIAYKQSILKANEWTLLYLIFKPKAKYWRPFIYCAGVTATVHVAYLKLEKGNRSTDWTPAPEDTQQQFDDIFSDSKVTPDEKQQLKMQWDSTQKEYDQIIVSAAVYGIVSSTLASKYTALGNLLIPILAPDKMSETTAGSFANISAAFSEYWKERSVVQGQISKAADNVQVGGRNLWIENKLVVGYISSTAPTLGSVVLTPTMPQHQTMAELTAVKGGSNIVWQLWNPNKTVNTTNANRVAFFDSEKAYISYVGLPHLTSSVYQSGVITVPPSAVYARLGAICGPPNSVDPDIKVKFEIGNKPTDWTPAPEDIDSAIDKAQTDADTANNLLGEIASDSKLTPSEKQSAALEWNKISGEVSGIVDEAKRFSVPYSTYSTAYESLKTYIEPLLKDLTTTSAIAGATFRSTFATYYNARQALLNAISAKSKEMVDGIQVGGRNLLLNSDFSRLDNWVIWGGQCFVDADNLFRGHNSLKISGRGAPAQNVTRRIKPNTSYIVSCWAKMQGIVKGEGGTEFGFYNEGGWISVDGTYSHVDCSDKDWTYYEKRFKSPATITASTSLSVGWYRNSAYGTTGNVWISEMKLEEGNKPGDWSPAPEDIETRVVSAEAQIVQNETDIGLRATKTEVATKFGEYYTKTQTDSAIKVNGDGITSSVKKEIKALEPGIASAQTTADQAQSRVTVAESSITQLAGSISNLVTDENGKSLMVQTGNGWTFNMGGTIKDIDAAEKNIREFQNHIKFGSDTNGKPFIDISAAQELTHVKILNDYVYVMKGANASVFMNNEELHAVYVTALNVLAEIIGANSLSASYLRVDGNADIIGDVIINKGSNQPTLILKRRQASGNDNQVVVYTASSSTTGTPTMGVALQKDGVTQGTFYVSPDEIWHSKSASMGRAGNPLKDVVTTKLNGMNSKIQSGKLVVNNVANETLIVPVTFPIPFSSPPDVMTQIGSTAVNRFSPLTIANITATGFTLYLLRTTTSGNTIYWMASE